MFCAKTFIALRKNILEVPNMYTVWIEGRPCVFQSSAEYDRTRFISQPIINCTWYCSFIIGKNSFLEEQHNEAWLVLSEMKEDKNIEPDKFYWKRGWPK